MPVCPIVSNSAHLAISTLTTITGLVCVVPHLMTPVHDEYDDTCSAKEHSICPKCEPK